MFKIEPLRSPGLKPTAEKRDIIKTITDLRKSLETKFALIIRTSELVVTGRVIEMDSKNGSVKIVAEGKEITLKIKDILTTVD